ncbi:uncharacterized protein LOC128229085 [Mya arenaria]|uniref:uncharacterized protein LOC128229085 n=1 Tax=Mya arenaria TaxID=6604 RepID=UPI0022E34B02|nr:uncharacterized protein LOC128229085 [Mya arenaria]
MRQFSPRRRTITKHASYPTAKSDRTRVPAEMNTETQANLRKTENELRTNKGFMDTIHRKSIGDLDQQRKVLEKSMLAYTAKMKAISNSRTSEQFNELYTCHSSRKDDDRKGVTLMDSMSPRSSICSLPADLQRARRHAEIRSLNGFVGVVVPSPVQEVRDSPDWLHSRIAQSASHKRTTHYSPVRKGTMSEHGEMEKKVSIERDTCLTKANEQLAVDHTTDYSNDSNTIYPKQTSVSKPGPRVSQGHFPWSLKADTDSLTDSAYSSGTEDEGLEQRDLTPDDESDSVSGRESLDLPFTHPRLHVRRTILNKRKGNSRKHNNEENLFKQVLLKQSKYSLNANTANTASL